MFWGCKLQLFGSICSSTSVVDKSGTAKWRKEELNGFLFHHQDFTQCNLYLFKKVWIQSSTFECLQRRSLIPPPPFLKILVSKILMLWEYEIWKVTFQCLFQVLKNYPRCPISHACFFTYDFSTFRSHVCLRFKFFFFFYKKSFLSQMKS